MGNNWVIEFVEKPLRIGFWDNLIYKGKDAGHSFLRLKNGSNIIGELHGFSYDPNKNIKSDFSFNPLKKIQYAFKRASDEFTPNALKVFHFDYHRTQNPNLHAQTLIEGDREKVLTQWLRALERGIEINEGSYEYRPITIFNLVHAQNCHTTTGELSRIIEGAQSITPKFASPGLTARFQDTAKDAIATGIHVGAEFMTGLNKALTTTTNLLLEISAPEKLERGQTPYATAASIDQARTASL